jgi:predicted amidohydrolase
VDVRVLLAAVRCAKGDIEGNRQAHVRLLEAAASAGCDLALFPEMSLTGSVDPAVHPQRLAPLDHPGVAALARASGETGVGVCFGIAERSSGGAPYIAQVFAADGCVMGVQRKRHLGDGEEPFTAASDSRVFEHAGTRFGVAICAEAGFDAPFDAAAAGGAQLVLFPAAPGLHGRRIDEPSWRAGFSWWETCALGDARRHAARQGLWIALAGQAGSTEDEDFPGLAALVGPDGSVAARLPDWREATLTVDIPV